MHQTQSLEHSRLLFSGRDLFFLILPLICEQFLTFLVGMADSIMIASVGEAAVSGVSLVDNVFILLIEVLTALATGGAVVIGQCLGMKAEDEARRGASQLLAFITVFSLSIMVLVYLGQDVILHGLFGAIDDTVYAHAKIYLLIAAASIPAIGIYSGVGAVYRAQGNSRTPMTMAVIMNIINVVGNAILIYGCHFGTPGVAIPTLLSRVVAAVIGLCIVCRKDKTVYITYTRRFRFDGPMIKNILGIGIPNGVENSLFQIGKLVVLGLITTFGTASIAANAVSMAVANFQILPGLSVAYAMVTVVSQCVGAGDEAQSRYYTRRLMLVAYMACWVSVAATLIALPLILRLYNLSPETAAMATKVLWTHGLMECMFWPAAFTLPAAFRATGNATFPMVISILSMVGVRIVMSYVLACGMGLGMWGTWVAMTMDWVFRTVIFIFYYCKGNKMKTVEIR